MQFEKNKLALPLALEKKDNSNDLTNNWYDLCKSTL